MHGRRHSERPQVGDQGGGPRRIIKHDVAAASTPSAKTEAGVRGRPQRDDRTIERAGFGVALRCGGFAVALANQGERLIGQRLGHPVAGSIVAIDREHFVRLRATIPADDGANLAGVIDARPPPDVEVLSRGRGLMWIIAVLADGSTVEIDRRTVAVVGVRISRVLGRQIGSIGAGFIGDAHGRRATVIGPVGNGSLEPLDVTVAAAVKKTGLNTTHVVRADLREQEPICPIGRIEDDEQSTAARVPRVGEQRVKAGGRGNLE